jgi:hypothetical protein
MIRHYDHQLIQLEEEPSPFGRLLPMDRAGLIGVRPRLHLKVLCV